MLVGRCHRRRYVRDLYLLRSHQLAPYPNTIPPLQYYADMKILLHFKHYISASKVVQDFYIIFLVLYIVCW